MNRKAHSTVLGTILCTASDGETLPNTLVKLLLLCLGVPRSRTCARRGQSTSWRNGRRTRPRPSWPLPKLSSTRGRYAVGTPQVCLSPRGRLPSHASTQHVYQYSIREKCIPSFSPQPCPCVYPQVNRIRELPQHPYIVATHTDAPEVLIWNTETQVMHYCRRNTSALHQCCISSVSVLYHCWSSTVSAR